MEDLPSAVLFDPAYLVISGSPSPQAVVAAIQERLRNPVPLREVILCLDQPVSSSLLSYLQHWLREPPLLTTFPP
jgi:hypothetical protein